MKLSECWCSESPPGATVLFFVLIFSFASRPFSSCLRSVLPSTDKPDGFEWRGRTIWTSSLNNGLDEWALAGAFVSDRTKLGHCWREEKRSVIRANYTDIQWLLFTIHQHLVQKPYISNSPMVSTDEPISPYHRVKERRKILTARCYHFPIRISDGKCLFEYWEALTSFQISYILRVSDA